MDPEERKILGPSFSLNHPPDEKINFVDLTTYRGAVAAFPANHQPLSFLPDLGGDVIYPSFGGVGAVDGTESAGQLVSNQNAFSLTGLQQSLQQQKVGDGFGSQYATFPQFVEVFAPESLYFPQQLTNNPNQNKKYMDVGLFGSNNGLPQEMAPSAVPSTSSLSLSESDSDNDEELAWGGGLPRASPFSLAVQPTSSGAWPNAAEVMSLFVAACEGMRLTPSNSLGQAPLPLACEGDCSLDLLHIDFHAINKELRGEGSVGSKHFSFTIRLAGWSGASPLLDSSVRTVEIVRSDGDAFAFSSFYSSLLADPALAKLGMVQQLNQPSSTFPFSALPLPSIPMAQPNHNDDDDVHGSVRQEDWENDVRVLVQMCTSEDLDVQRAGLQALSSVMEKTRQEEEVGGVVMLLKILMEYPFLAALCALLCGIGGSHSASPSAPPSASLQWLASRVLLLLCRSVSLMLHEKDSSQNNNKLDHSSIITQLHSQLASQLTSLLSVLQPPTRYSNLDLKRNAAASLSHVLSWAQAGGTLSGQLDSVGGVVRLQESLRESQDPALTAFANALHLKQPAKQLFKQP